MDYAALAATATRLIASAGQAAVLTRTERGDYDPNTAQAAADSTTTADCRVVVQNYRLRDVDGSRIKAGDLLALMGPEVTLAPKPGDLLSVDGVAYRVITADIGKPGPTVLYYQLQVRRE